MRKLIKHIGFIFMLNLLVIFAMGSIESKASESYKVKGTKIVVRVKQNKDITSALDDALAVARDKASKGKVYSVVVPKGSYKLSGTLHIYSNTTLDLSAGVTLTYVGKESKVMLMTGTNGRYRGYNDYNNSKACKGYSGFENITVKGGVFKGGSSNTSSMIRMAHAKNVTLDGVTFSGGGCAHQVEVCAINGFYVTNCTFKDFGNKTTKTGEKQEALQLDVPCNSKIFRNVYLDGTVMKNVEVTGCNFINVPRGVGSHSMLRGAYHSNIKIQNNTFKNLSEEAIIALNYVNLEVTNNTIENCGGGVLVQFFKSNTKTIFTTIFDGKKEYKGTIVHDAQTIIRDNTIKTKYSKTCDEMEAIKVYGFKLDSAQPSGEGKKVAKGHYYISGITIENNKITSAGYGIHLMNVQNAKVNENSITIKNVSSKDKNKDRYDGIFVEKNSKKVSITKNTIKNPTRNGVFVQINTYISEITDNRIENCKKTGINFYDKSGVTKKISRNTISDCDLNGVLVSTSSCIKGELSYNEITGIGKHGFSFYNKSSLKGKMKENIFVDVARELYADPSCKI